MTPKERYGIQIAATVFGIVGVVLLWYAIWSSAWVQGKTKDLELKYKLTEKQQLDLNILSAKVFASRGLFTRCTTADHADIFSTPVDDTTCCSVYARRDFVHDSTYTRIGAIQNTGLWASILGSVTAILLFVTMCHMGAKPRQDVRWAAMGTGIGTFLLAVTTIVLYSKWSSDLTKRQPSKFPKASPSSGMQSYGVGIAYVGLAVILIGISTHKASTITPSAPLA